MSLDELIKDIETKWIGVNNGLKLAYGDKQPPTGDNIGWMLIGRKEALSYILMKLEEERMISEVSSVEG